MIRSTTPSTLRLDELKPSPSLLYKLLHEIRVKDAPYPDSLIDVFAKMPQKQNVINLSPNAATKQRHLHIELAQPAGSHIVSCGDVARNHLAAEDVHVVCVAVVLRLVQ